jgi:FKBP-type peptidyl-prolyl cis-trans isomerase
MKSFISATSLALVLSLNASAQAVPGSAPAAEASAVEAAPQITEEQLLGIYGWMTGMRAGLNRLGLSEAEAGAFSRGMAAASEGVDLDLDLEQFGPLVSQLVQQKFETQMTKLSAAEAARSVDFWSGVKANPAITMTESGLGYEILTPGSDEHPNATSEVTMHYTGKLIDDTVFDSSEGGEPFTGPLAQSLPAWAEGVPLIGIGGSIRLYVPPALGFGDFGSPNGDIAPGASLIFDLTLVAAVEAPSEIIAPTLN